MLLVTSHIVLLDDNVKMRQVLLSFYLVNKMFFM